MKKYNYQTLIRLTSEDAELLHKIGDETGLPLSKILRVGVKKIIREINEDGVHSAMSMNK